jgi:hypothetical protein
MLQCPPARVEFRAGPLLAFISDKYGADPASLTIAVTPLRGGLEAPEVGLVRARIAAGHPRRLAFVIKRIAEHDSREIAAYEALMSSASGVQLAPRLLGAMRIPDGWYLFLERVRPWKRWPWATTSNAVLVLQNLAHVHAMLPAADPACEWDYESALANSAQQTIALLEEMVCLPEFTHLRPRIPALRRIVSSLPRLRHDLASALGGPAMLHGDVHPGNAMIRMRRGVKEAVLLDWGRTRSGSPLEDVCSWLLSLGYWEPEARRRNDSLLQAYLAARGYSTRIARDLRDLYWLAGASNALAGALRYHLLVARGSLLSAPGRTPHATRAAADWLRVVRRADACWRG